MFTRKALSLEMKVLIDSPGANAIGLTGDCSTKVSRFVQVLVMAFITWPTMISAISSSSWSACAWSIPTNLVLSSFVNRYTISFALVVALCDISRLLEFY